MNDGEWERKQAKRVQPIEKAKRQIATCTVRPMERGECNMILYVSFGDCIMFLGTVRIVINFGGTPSKFSAVYVFR